MENKKVQVWIHRPDANGEAGWKVLILRLTEARGGFWQPVTGGVDPGEPVDDAALREAREETGLDFPRSATRLGYEFRFERGGRTFHETTFALKAARSDSEIRLDPREHVEYRWVHPEEALRIVKHASNAEALRKLIERIEAEAETNQGSR